MDEEIVFLNKERKDIQKKIKKIKPKDYLEFKRLHLRFDYKEIKLLLKERRKQLTKEILKLIAKKKREEEVKINLVKEANYIKKLLFKDYNFKVTKAFKDRMFLKIHINHGYHYSLSVKDFKNLMEIRIKIMILICQFRFEKSREEHPFEDYEKRIKEDFFENTVKDKKYEKIVVNMGLQDL